METFKALILGIIQGLTEFLPVSSSGHLEIGKEILGIDLGDPEKNFMFTVVVHFATVCSIILVYFKELTKLSRGLFEFRWNESTQYIGKLVLSSLPVVVLGIMFDEYIERLFEGRLILVGSMLIVTAILLSITFYTKSKNKEISFLDAYIIGIAQAVAVLPGISRSGATIATGLMLQNDREKTARFSFLMLLIPVLGKIALDLISGKITDSNTEIMPLLAGFTGAFITGFLACKLMIRIVKNSKLIYFAVYCFVIGVLAIILNI